MRLIEASLLISLKFVLSLINQLKIAVDQSNGAIHQYGSLNTIYAPEIPLNPPKARGTLRAFLSPPF